MKVLVFILLGVGECFILGRWAAQRQHILHAGAGQIDYLDGLSFKAIAAPFLLAAEHARTSGQLLRIVDSAVDARFVGHVDGDPGVNKEEALRLKADITRAIKLLPHEARLRYTRG